MTEIRATVRRWGSSLATVLPPEILRRQSIREGDEVLLDVRKANRPEDVFGLLAARRMDPQAIKDRLRREDNE